MSEQPETPEAADETGDTPEAPTAAQEPVTAAPAPAPAPGPPPAAPEPAPSAPAPPPAAVGPSSPPPVSTEHPGFDYESAGQEDGLLVQRPEIAVGAAFAGGLALALLLKRLAR